MKKKFISFLLAVTILFNTTSMVLADENQTVEYEESVSATDEFNQDVEFTMSKGSTFVVSLPKEVELIDKDYILQAGIYADIASNQKIVVEPIDVDPSTNNIELILKNEVAEDVTPKADLIGEVTRVNTEFAYNYDKFCSDLADINKEEYQIDICSITTELKSGKWKGELPIRIMLDTLDLSIGVNATDKDGNSLNATAHTIIGETKDTLLNGLVDSGLIESVDEVDALIEVNSDAFDDIAETTFDVSNIAQPGDTVVILHYDEATQVWERIGTETVDANGQIKGDFTSYSPVAFVKVDSTTGSHEHLHNYVNAVCKCGSHLPGFYDENDHLVVSWEDSGIEIGVDYTDSNFKTSITGGYKVTRSYPGIVKVVIPEGETYIGTFAFASCSFKEVVLPKSLTRIGIRAFSSCGALSTINLQEGLISIGDYAFYKCPALTSIVIPSTVTTIRNCAFRDCTGLTSVFIPSSVTTVDSNIFHGLSTVILCESTVPSNLMGYCVTGGVTKEQFELYRSINKWAEKIEIPDGLVVIPNYAFKGWGVKEVVIPESVKVIGNQAFFSCGNMTSVTFEGNSNLTTIGNYAFYNCFALQGLELPDGVTTIGTEAFKDCDSFVSFTIPSSVTSVGQPLFYFCNNLTTVTVESSFIRDEMFYECPTLSKIIISSNVKHIGVNVVRACPAVSTVVFEDPNSWYIGSTAMSAEDLSNTATAATYLKTQYYNVTWTKK